MAAVTGQSVSERGRGRPKLLTKEEVLEAARRITENEGLDALSMPRLGRELGTATMTVYGYIRSKQELFDDLVDLMISGLPEVVRKPSVSWRRTIERGLLNYRAYLVKRPALVRLLTIQLQAPRSGFAFSEAIIEELERGGLSRKSALDGYLALYIYTLGSASWEITRLHDQGATTFKQSLLAELGREEHAFPHLVELADRASRDPDDRYRFGLGCLLDGLESAAKKKSRRAR